MIDIEKLDDQLYGAMYGLPRVGNYHSIWARIKNNPIILREAVKIKRNKWNSGYIVNGLTIANAMLIDYKNVDTIAYNNLIDSIYSNVDIARIVVNGASNGGFSFLLMSLWNSNVKLTEKQKEFAVNEAMNKIGTTRFEKNQELLSKELDNKGMNNNDTMYLDFGGSINPISVKSGAQYINNLFASMSDTQAHGSGVFDIRYHILKNSNWTLEEKQKLIMDFWYDAEDYDEHLEQWELGIIDDYANYKDNISPLISIEELYNYSYNDLLKLYEDEKTTNKIWGEIQFCKQMHKLRPTKLELEYENRQKVLK